MLPCRPLYKLLLNFFPLHYFPHLKSGKFILWCYLIWYLVTLNYYFDPLPNIWLNSLGITAIIGFGLLLSVGSAGSKLSNP